MCSRDDGTTWDYLDSPYEGSLFGILPLAARTYLIYGLRGHVFRTSDGGQSFEPWTVPVQGASAMVESPDGAILAVGLNGVRRLAPPLTTPLLRC